MALALPIVTINVPAENWDTVLDLYTRAGYPPTVAPDGNSATVYLPTYELQLVKDAQSLRAGDLFNLFLGVASAQDVDIIFNGALSPRATSPLAYAVQPPHNITVIPTTPSGQPGHHKEYTLRLASITFSARNLSSGLAEIGVIYNPPY